MTLPQGLIPLGAAAILAGRHGFELVNEATIKIKTIVGFDVCIWRAAFNWRLVLQSHTDWTSFSNGWCYTGPHAWPAALSQALAWPDDDDGHHVPEFWYKNPYTGQIQEEYLNR
jgi:hypothetical protein